MRIPRLVLLHMMRIALNASGPYLVRVKYAECIRIRSLLCKRCTIHVELDFCKMMGLGGGLLPKYESGLLVITSVFSLSAGLISLGEELDLFYQSILEFLVVHMLIPPPVRPPRITKFLKPYVLKMHFTNTYVIAQVIHTPTATVASSASSQEKLLRRAMENTRDIAAAARIGKLLGERLLLKDIPAVTICLKREQKYHGKVKAVIDSIQEADTELRQLNPSLPMTLNSLVAPQVREASRLANAASNMNVENCTRLNTTSCRCHRRLRAAKSQPGVASPSATTVSTGRKNGGWGVNSILAVAIDLDSRVKNLRNFTKVLIPECKRRIAVEEGVDIDLHEWEFPARIKTVDNDNHSEVTESRGILVDTNSNVVKLITGQAATTEREGVASLYGHFTSEEVFVLGTDQPTIPSTATVVEATLCLRRCLRVQLMPREKALLASQFVATEGLKSVIDHWVFEKNA
ncbi:hypothetical protein ACLOJK_026236 [Asimina triloba]